MVLRPVSMAALTLAALLATGCGGAEGTPGSPDEALPGEQPPAQTPDGPSDGQPLPPDESPAPDFPIETEPQEPLEPGAPPEPEEPLQPEEPEDSEQPQPEEPAPAPGLPAEILDLARWKLTLPIDTPHAGDPDEIVQPELATFAIDPFFLPTEAGDGVVFRAPVDGATTSGSGYPRSELREMNEDGSDEASWSTDSGIHTLQIRQAITHLPEEKAHVVAGQIHDADDDVIMIRLEGEHLFIEGDGDELATLDPAYELGTVFDVRIVASEGRIRVFYDGELALDLPHRADGCYFKAGAYTQSNLEKGDEPGAYGEVVIYDLQLSHT